MNTAVMLYKPNIIGYVRLILLLSSIFAERLAFLTLYFSSVALDYFDGFFARMFHEESKLGASLDMITDRISTTILCCKIIASKPAYAIRCMVYVFVDLLSHFLYFVSMVHGGTHHKLFDGNPLISFYYNPIVLKIMCCGSEAYFMALYYTGKKNKAYAPILNALAVIAIAKTFFHAMHLFMGVAILSTK